MTFRLAVLALALLVSTASAAADARYRVDLILFLDKLGGGETASSDGVETGRGLDVQDRATLAAQGIQVLPESAFGLGDSLQRLRNSRRYQPLIALAWTQKNPPAERGPRLRLRWPETGDDPSVDGSVALLLGRYLHLDADVGIASGSRFFRLNERRRLKRDELNHLDSSKLGILAKVTKVQ